MEIVDSRQDVHWSGLGSYPARIGFLMCVFGDESGFAAKYAFFEKWGVFLCNSAMNLREMLNVF